MKKKKIVPLLLIAALIFTLAPVSPFADKASAADLKSMIEGATSDVSIEISEDMSIDEDITIPEGVNVTLEGKNDARLTVNKSFLSTNSNLTLHNLNINATTDVFKGKTKCKLIIDGGEMSTSTYIVSGNGSAQRPYLYIYSGKIQTTSTTTSMMSSSAMRIYFCPTGDIDLETACKTWMCKKVYVIAQENFKIAECAIDGTNVSDDILSSMNNSTASASYALFGTSTQIKSSITFKVKKTAAPASKPVSGSGQVENGPEYIWSYGGKIEESGDNFVITPCNEETMKYAVETVYIDGKAVTDYTAADDGTVTIAKSKVSKSLVVMFGYTGNFNDPANGTLSVSRDGKVLTSGDILHGGDVLEISYEDKDGVYALDELELTGITKIDDSYVVTAKNGDPTPAVSATVKQLKNVEVKLGYDNSSYVKSYSLWVNDELVKENEPSKTGTEAAEEAVVMVKKGDVIKVKPVEIDDQICIGVVNDITNHALDYNTAKSLFEYHEEDGTFTHTVGDEKTVGITMTTSAVTTIECETPEHGSINASAAGKVTVDGKAYYPNKYFNEKNMLVFNDVLVTVKPDEGYRVSYVAHVSKDGTVGSHFRYVSENKYTYDIAGDGLSSAAETLTAEFVKDEGDIKVSNEDELREVAELSANGDELLGVNVILTDDIAVTGKWTPIGSYYIPFRGSFDGQGHKITGLSEFEPVKSNNKDDYYCYGLFGRIDKGSEVKNVTVCGEVSTSFTGDNDTYIGSVVGYAVDSSISGCQSYVDYTTENNLRGAGIVGNMKDSSISSCINYGDFTCSNGRTSYDGSRHTISSSAGGIVLAMSNSQMKNCINYGSMTYTDTEEYKDEDQKGNVIGIYDTPVGYFGGLAYNAYKSVIENSANKGDITGNLIQMGGLAGASSYTTIKNCYNTGELHNTGKYQTKVFRVYAGGLVGKATDPTAQYEMTFENCYSSTKPVQDYTGTRISDMCDSTAASYSNCYSKADIEKLSGGLTASMLSSSFKDDTNNLNGGYPMLTWESDEKDTTTHDVSFTVNPDNAKVQVFSDSTMTNEIEAESGKYALTRGTYYYKASCDGYLDKTGSFKVSNNDKSVDVELQEAVEITFDVDPAEIVVSVTDSTGAEVSAAEGKNNTFKLAKGQTYKYSAYPEGYNGISGSFTATQNRTISVKLTKAVSDAKALNGGMTITEGGVYKLADGATGKIIINTTEPVTIVGSGVGDKNIYSNIYIDCAEGTDLTLQDVYISNTQGTANMINFKGKGKGNNLRFEGTNILDMNTGATGYAMIHVPDSAELTVSGGTAYLYKREQGAGIGGNGGAKDGAGQAAETNGKITIKDAKIFAKNSKQGALIGAGANAGKQEPQPITIENSELNLIAISRAAAIGGSAGSGGASKGSDVTIKDSIVNINVDWTGSAIGGGGYADGNDSDGGTLKTSGSSIRTFIDTNAIGSWEVDEPGVHENKAITADITDESGDNELYLAEIDTTVLPDTDTYEVKVDGKLVYSGGLHKYAFVNENYTKNNQSDIESTIDNWTELDDPCLYIYMTGEKHNVTVNGYKVNVDWNSVTKKLKVDTSEDIVKTLFDDINVKDSPEKIKEQLAKAEAAYEKLTDEQKANVASTVEAKLKELRDYEEQKAKKDEDIQKTTDKLAGEIDKVNAAGTGDTSSMMPALVIMLIAAAGAGTVVVTRRRRLR